MAHLRVLVRRGGPPAAWRGALSAAARRRIERQAQLSVHLRREAVSSAQGVVGHALGEAAIVTSDTSSALEPVPTCRRPTSLDRQCACRLVIVYSYRLSGVTKRLKGAQNAPKPRPMARCAAQCHHADHQRGVHPRRSRRRRGPDPVHVRSQWPTEFGDRSDGRIRRLRLRRDRQHHGDHAPSDHHDSDPRVLPPVGASRNEGLA